MGSGEKDAPAPQHLVPPWPTPGPGLTPPPRAACQWPCSESVGPALRAVPCTEDPTDAGSPEKVALAPVQVLAFGAVSDEEGC